MAKFLDLRIEYAGEEDLMRNEIFHILQPIYAHRDISVLDGTPRQYFECNSCGERYTDEIVKKLLASKMKCCKGACDHSKLGWNLSLITHKEPYLQSIENIYDFFGMPVEDEVVGHLKEFIKKINSGQ